MRHFNKYRHGSRDQRGLASIIIVFTLITLIAAISLGFARLMNRSLQNSVNSQLSAAAEFATQSGINDAAAWVQANPSRTVTQCNELITDSGDLKFGGIAAADLSGDEIVRYTCVLVNPSPKDYVRQNNTPWKSFVLRLSTSGPADSFMFSWQSTDRNKNEFLGGQKDFLDENSWGTGQFAPVLKISLFQVNQSTSAIGPENKTFYLYPNQGSGQFGSISYSQPSGEKAEGNCDTNPASQTAPLAAPFSGEASYDCNTVVYGLQPPPAGWSYYAKITPFYNNTDIRVQANGGGNLLNFNNVQSVVDVTAKANSAVKRLQARVAVNDPMNVENDNLPDDALRSAGAICKRLVLPDSTNTIQIDGSLPACNFVNQTLPPSVTLTASPTTIGVGGFSTLTWSTTNNPSDCTAGGDWSGSKNPAGGSESTGTLSTAGVYTYTITCTNPAGSGTDTETVTVSSSPPSEVCGNGIDDNGNGQVDEGCGGSGGSCPNPAGGGDGNQDPCVRYFNASRNGDGSVSFRFRADHCGSGVSISYTGGSRSFGGYDGNGADPAVVMVGNPTNSAGSATITCLDNRPSGGWSSASAGFDSFGSPPPPPPPPCPSPPGTGPCGPPPPPPEPYIMFSDCHGNRIYHHWSNGFHQGTGVACIE